MTIPLSERTRQLAQVLFDEPLRSRVIDALVREVSENIPLCENSTPEGMERIRFAVMKLIAENETHFNVALNHAQMDWRDLFMAAGFADSAEQHRHWYHKVIKDKNG